MLKKQLVHVIPAGTCFAQLSPSDEVISETYKKTLSDARLSVRKTRAVHTGEKKEGETENSSETATSSVRN